MGGGKEGKVIAMNDLELKTPAELDMASSPIGDKLHGLTSRRFSYRQDLDKARAKRGLATTIEARNEYEIRDLERTIERFNEKHGAEIEALKAQLEPYTAEWVRRGGWSRYWHCVADGGHIHVMGCFTLRPFKTLVSFRPELSGLSEAELVEKVQYHACTHCFSSAPLHPKWFVWEREAAEKKIGDKLAKWEKGYAMRQKKVDNIGKRLAKARARLESADEFERHSASYNIEWESKSLGWAEKEVERWLAKKPG
jgi:hypothetical protein